jgi:hypothetical protein
MHRKYSSGWQFEQLVAELLCALGHHNVRCNISIQGQNSLPEEVDITYEHEGSLHIVEVKLYRYFSPPPTSTFARALRQIVRKRKELGATTALLVLGCPIAVGLKSLAQGFPNIEIWDADDLFQKSSEFPELTRKFENIFEVSAPAPDQDTTELSQDSYFIESPKTGRLLADAILSIAPGREGASQFETACINALKYLFELDLHGWHEQLNTDDELHRRDLICRILPKAEVWSLMLTDIGSRYVIFEFKNYSEEITQKEVVTTERYLYPSALRTVAILISPKGCAASATKVIQGAMRENGKLILSLSVSEIEELLVSKDDGGDPNTYLFDKVDQFLMRLGR